MGKETDGSGGAKDYACCTMIVISCLLLGTNLLYLNSMINGGKEGLSWSLRAAEEGQAVAEIACSGHGRALLDGSVCACDSCYEGFDCSIFSSHCVANAERYSAAAAWIESKPARRILTFRGESEWKPSWSRRAAQEAEVVAAIPCSGHGRAYLDGLVLNGQKPVCECNPCYGGSNCSQLLSNCSASAGSGDPYFLEPFWMKHAASSAILVAGWHRMGYTFSDGSYISEMLVNHIRKLHKTVGNANTEGKYIIFGAGSTQLLNAAVYALSPNSSLEPPAKVVATAPYYAVYRSQTQLFNSLDYRFAGDTSLWKNNLNESTRFIEFVTSPNNPDGKLTKAVLDGPNAKFINDHAYYWPHFTPIPSPADEDVMIFTLSKITGHAGTRFGWAVIKDEAVYEKMVTYMSLNSLGVSRDAQLRALKILDVVLEGQGRDLFGFGYTTMRVRWARLRNITSRSKRFSLQKITPQYCSYFRRVREFSPAYAWLRCEREEDKNCYGILSAAKIEGYEGSRFSGEDRYVRLSLIRSQDEFEMLIHRLTKLVAGSGK